MSFCRGCPNKNFKSVLFLITKILLGTKSYLGQTINYKNNLVLKNFNKHPQNHALDINPTLKIILPKLVMLSIVNFRERWEIVASKDE